LRYCYDCMMEGFIIPRNPDKPPIVSCEMQIDYDCLKQLLEAFAAAPRPTTDIEELKAAGLDYETDQFLFHMEILDDYRLIAQPDGDPGIGVQRSIDGYVVWGVIPLRLTAAGHEFLDGLRSKEAMAIVKASFKHASIETVKTVMKTVLEESAKAAVTVFMRGT
jgi:hypothetical protein